MKKNALLPFDAPTQRPVCPKCDMRMITTRTLPGSKTMECLRCGHQELILLSRVIGLEEKRGKTPHQLGRLRRLEPEPRT
jgi:hypothetical protein